MWPNVWHGVEATKKLEQIQKKKKKPLKTESDKHTPSKEHRRTERGIISPPNGSFVMRFRSGNENILTLMSVHIPTAASWL